MSTKPKKNGAVAAVFLIFLLLNALSGGGKSAVTILYVVLLVGIVWGSFLLFSRLGRSRDGEIPPAAGTSAPKADFPVSPRREPPAVAPRSAERERTVSPVYRADGASSEEQWKSLLEAGLITREEYREKHREKFSGTGRG